MTQDKLLEIIREHPGIVQSEIKKYPGIKPYDVSEMLGQLRLKGLIYRVPTKNRKSWLLYPVQEKEMKP